MGMEVHGLLRESRSLWVAVEVQHQDLGKAVTSSPFGLDRELTSSLSHAGLPTQPPSGVSQGPRPSAPALL